ncbi:hypothetical protein LCM23_13025 [Cytobacillus kochii]|uniref:hypothetical protein n=1 Tax=Cytobacillus kochii TaxID=859143 RepID=UPI001CD3CD3D|nr:hypothetical protein [Cytobacillus kochii]MCA1027017.1 hypothetical protein [Cytobacillus kochii]
MTLSDHIEAWLEEQEKAGKTRDEIHNTHFAYKDCIAVIKKSGRKDYKLEFYMQQKAVFFK